MTIIITSIVALTVLGLLFYAGHKFGRFMRDMEERDRYWREIHRKEEESKRISGLLKCNGRDLMIKVILLLLLASPAFGQSFHAKKYRHQASKEVPCPHFKSVYHQPIKSKKEAPGFVTRRKKRVKIRTA